MIPSVDPVARIGFLSLILQWEGRLNNARLRALFGLSGVRASEWIREFRALNQDATWWNSKSRSFHATSHFYRAIKLAGSTADGVSDSLNRYFSLVGLPRTSMAHVGSRVTWAAFPELSAPTPKVFATLSEAAQARWAVQIWYRSMREPSPHQRTIFPHNLVRAGRRWHVRAYCIQNNDFRDFALGRIADITLQSDQAKYGEADDKAWNTQVQVQLIAHPELTDEQKDLIRFEYLNDTASRTETCRGPLVGYFIQDIRAATDFAAQRPPDYQLAVANVEEVKSWLFPTRAS